MSGGTFALMQKKRQENDKLNRLKTAFKKHDKNGDGALNQDEWLKVIRDSGSEMSRWVFGLLYSDKVVKRVWVRRIVSQRTDATTTRSIKYKTHV